MKIKQDKQIVNYGGELHLMKSYTGSICEINRLKGVVDIKAYCIYEGDEFEQQYNIETAALKISKFNPKFEIIDMEKIKGAFAVVIGEMGIIQTEIMNINQLKTYWQKSIENEEVSAKEALTDDAAKKIVINRACKSFIDISDERVPFIEASINRDKRWARELEKEQLKELKDKNQHKDEVDEEIFSNTYGTRVLTTDSVREAEEKNNNEASEVSEGPDF